VGADQHLSGRTRIHKTISSDWGLCHYKKKNAYLLLYVDDVLIAAAQMAFIDGIKNASKQKWKWSDIGAATYILKLKLDRHRSSRTISLSQEGYIQRVLDHFGMQDAKTVTTPLHNATLARQEGTVKIDNQRQMRCQQIGGSLMWCRVGIRLNRSLNAI
jgi:hypothetical protein